MEQSSHAQEELAYARIAFDALSRTASLAEIASNWKELLRRLERLWNKADAHFSHSPNWSGWKGRFEKPRATDPLPCVESFLKRLCELPLDTIRYRAAEMESPIIRCR